MIRKKAKVNSIDTSQAITDINETFIDACENGDYLTVVCILGRIKDFNIDVTDELGRSALRLSVENEHLEVVQVLLDKSDSQKMREALLLAIYLGHTQIAESILRHPKYKVLNEKKFVNEETDSFWQTPSSDDAQFSPDITPLILASQYKRTEIVQLLLTKGDRIIKPHDYQCKCTDCSNRFKFDSLRHAKSRLNTYRGLASESYLSLASVDPIQAAFELGHELRYIATQEKYFKAEYLQLSEQLSNYTVKLLNNVRGRDELEIILNKYGKEDEEKYHRLARLDLALKYQEKPFVAHYNCQQKLVEIWYSGMRKMSKSDKLTMNVAVIFFVIFIPFFSILYMIAPKTKFGSIMAQPCIKFIAHTASYLAFVIFIIASSIKIDANLKYNQFSKTYPNYNETFVNYVANTSFKFRFPTSDFIIRDENPTILDYILSVWILGFIWMETKLLFESGIKTYSQSSYNNLKFIMNVLFFASFALKFYTIVMVKLELKKIIRKNFWNNVINLDPNKIEKQQEILKTFNWLNADRYYWPPWDPINLSEGLFSLATIFAFGRICFLLPINETIGPLQITLAKMTNDVLKFISIFIIIFIGFLISLSSLYAYYLAGVRSDVEVIAHPISDASNAELNFGTLGRTLNTYFWAIFGLDSGRETSLAPNYNNYLTERIGSIIYGLFHVATILMLVNMLIAMMTKSYERIRDASDIEWKFARSRIYMEYIKEGSTLPVPFNLIPTPKGVYLVSKKVFYYIWNKRKLALIISDNNKGAINKCDTFWKNKKYNQNIQAAKNKEQIEDFEAREDFREVSRRYSNTDVLTYRKVIQRIVKRFLLRQRESEKREGGIEEIKQDLQMVRFEMHNDLKKSGKNSLKSLHNLHNGVAIMGDQIMNNSSNNLLSDHFIDFKSYKTDIEEIMQEFTT